MTLASFYRKFIKKIVAIRTLITDCLKKEDFQWTETAEESFHQFKVILQTELVIKLPKFIFLE